MTAALRRHYGATPLHVLAHVVVFAIVGWVALILADTRDVANILVWFVGALILHDLVLLPFYSVLDRIGSRAAPRAHVNHVRVPAALSALMLLLFFPPMLGRNDGSFARVAGVEPDGYLGRWLLLTAALFAASALLLLVLSARRRRRAR